MKSLLQSNISWLMLFYLFTVLLTYAMEENNTKIYSVEQLQHDFSKLMKNPQKYVEFYLEADNTDDLKALKAKKTYDPNAGGLYKLLPYYQKINILDEKEIYAIKWCEVKKEYQLIKVNPLRDSILSSSLFDDEQIATLFKGDQFSRPTHADMKAYTTYEKMKSVVKMLSEKNKELKMQIVEQRKQFKIYVLKQKDNIKIANELMKTKTEEHEKALKDANEFNKLKNEEHEKVLEEMEKLKTNLNEKEKEIINLVNQRGSLAYKLSHAKEFEQKFLDLKVETKPLTDQTKIYEIKIKQLEKTLKESEDKVGDFEKKLKKQVSINTKKELDIVSFTESANSREKIIKRLVTKQDEHIEEIKRGDRIYQSKILEKNETIEEMKEIISNLQKKIEKTKENSTTGSSQEEDMYGDMGRRCNKLYVSDTKTLEVKKEKKPLGRKKCKNGDEELEKIVQYF